MISVADWIGIYGAAVATGVLVWSIVKNRPRIKIDIWGIGEWVGEREEYTVTVVVTNKSDYPIKLDYYGFRDKSKGKAVVSPYYPETDKPIVEVPSRDQYTLRFKIDDIKIAFKDGTIHLHKFFFLADRTGKVYERKIPKYIISEALHTSSNLDSNNSLE
jgi:hypothetical protein